MLTDTLHVRIREKFLGKMKWLGDEENCVMQTFKINTTYFPPNDWASNMRGENVKFAQNISR
jgi:hypothetical protein